MVTMCKPVERWKRELDLLREKNKDVYGKKIIDDVEQVMKIIDKQGHSGLSINIFKDILIKAIDGKCQTPLTGEDSEWSEPLEYLKGDRQNIRVPSLFKKEDGTIIDNDRVIFVDTYGGANSQWYAGGFITKLIHKKYPIVFPYNCNEVFYVYGKTMYLDENDNDVTNEHPGSFNYKTYDYVKLPNGEKVELNITFDERTGKYTNL